MSDDRQPRGLTHQAQEGRKTTELEVNEDARVPARQKTRRIPKQGERGDPGRWTGPRDDEQ